MVGDILQPTHLLFVLLVALLVLGPKRLPEVGKTLGSGLRDFREALSGEASHDRHEPEPVEQRYQPPVEPDPTPVAPVGHTGAAAPEEPSPAPLQFAAAPEPPAVQPVATVESRATDTRTEPDA